MAFLKFFRHVKRQELKILPPMQQERQVKMNSDNPASNIGSIFCKRRKTEPMFFCLSASFLAYQLRWFLRMFTIHGVKMALAVFMVFALGLQTTLAKPPGAEELQCYGRTYSDTHLKQHPLQTIETILVKISRDVGNFFWVNILIEGRFDATLFTNSLNCKASRNKNADIECNNGVVDDYGAVTVKWNDKKGHILLYNKSGFMLYDIDDQYNSNKIETKPKGDDVFRLDKKSCSGAFGIF